MLRRDALSLGVLFTAGGLTSVFPGATEAAAVVRPGLLVRGVRGTWTSRGNASGSLTADVLVQALSLGATGALRVHGRIAGVGGGIAPFVSQPFVTTTRLSRSTPGEASCGVLTLRLGTINLSLRGLAIDLVPIRLDTTGLTGGRQQRLAGELCRLVALLNGTASLAAVQALLVEINRTLAAGLITLPKA